MDKKLNRKIGYQKTTPTKEVAAPPAAKKNGIESEATPKDIIDWIKSHPFFAWSRMCNSIGINKGNFSVILKSKREPSIVQSTIDKIIPVLKEYGYQD